MRFDSDLAKLSSLSASTRLRRFENACHTLLGYTSTHLDHSLFLLLLLWMVEDFDSVLRFMRLKLVGRLGRMFTFQGLLVEHSCEFGALAKVIIIDMDFGRLEEIGCCGLGSSHLLFVIFLKRFDRTALVIDFLERVANRAKFLLARGVHSGCPRLRHKHSIRGFTLIVLFNQGSV